MSDGGPQPSAAPPAPLSGSTASVSSGGSAASAAVNDLKVARPGTPPANPSPSPSPATAGHTPTATATPTPSTPPSATAGAAASSTPPSAGRPATPPTTTAPLTGSALIESKFRSEIDELVSGMGFARTDVIEALTVVQINKDVIPRTTEYLLADARRRENVRLTEMEKRLRKQEEAHRTEMDRAQREFKQQKHKLQLEAYTNFLVSRRRQSTPAPPHRMRVLSCVVSLSISRGRSAAAQTVLLADKVVSETEAKRMEAMRSSADITDDEHRTICATLGIGSGIAGGVSWQNILDEGKVRADKLEISGDCAHCHNSAPGAGPTDHIILDCMHLW
jgi:hypothetical protein